MAEIHEHHRQENELGESGWYVCPCHTKGVPLEDIHGAEDYQHHQHGEKPLGIHQSLSLLPIPPDNVAKNKEGKVLHELNK